jgi:hypothetical protein
MFQESVSTQQLFNVVSDAHIDKLIEYYDGHGSYDTATMNKISVDNGMDLCVEICKSLIPFDVEYQSGNFYEHSGPYIPSSCTVPASLVVFDQVYVHNSVTWCLDQPIMYFSINTGVAGNPCDYDVLNLTNREVDDALYKNFLFHHTKECFSGLSGNAYPFEVGSAIIFDNRRIHCTSHFVGTKLGVSLRFKKL